MGHRKRAAGRPFPFSSLFFDGCITYNRLFCVEQRCLVFLFFSHSNLFFNDYGHWVATLRTLCSLREKTVSESGVLLLYLGEGGV
jgi:hypothetical protein